MKNKKESVRYTRRNFLKRSTVISSGIIIIPRHVIGGSGYIAPSDRVNIGIVGTGGQSMFSIKELCNLEDVQITTIADPAEIWKNDILYSSDTGRAPTKKFIEDYYSGKTPNYQISEYQDFRKMIANEKSLDAIVCATPDNTHAYVSIYAMRAGKHVYCEKPLTHNIWEARKMREVAREQKVATQMGNQGTARDVVRQTVEYLRSGVIGKVLEAHSWVNAGRWLPGLKGYPEEVSPVHPGFDWDLWLGPTLFRPYNKMYTPVKWRDFWVFGCGALGDFGCHDMNVATWAFDLHSPESVQIFPAGNSGSSVIAPYGEIGYYHFKADGKQIPLKLTWYSGGLKPDLPEVIPGTVPLQSRGALFVGEKGVLLNNGGPGGNSEIFPESLRNSTGEPAEKIPRSKGHHREWIDAIKGGPAAMSNFDYGARLTEITLLGVLSLRLGGKKIFWDSKNMKAKGLPEADPIIREQVRKGWEME
jgi:predicted dehydrogenase